MRRIIERVVTVVTTTTWTISWQDDPSQGKPSSVADDFPKPEVSDKTAKHIQKFSSVTLTKEADPAEMKTETDSTADEPPQDPHSNQSKIEGK